MSRKINCCECKVYVGEIRDATLMKNMVFLCDNCNTKRITNSLKDSLGYGNDNMFEDIFGKMVGDEKK